jgi:protein-tyrosine phosphatase
MTGMQIGVSASGIRNAAVNRTADGGVELSWEPADGLPEVCVFHGESPEGIDRGRPLARTTAGRVRLDGLDPAGRHFFELVPQGGRPLVVGERRIHAEGSSNLRDLGGYAAADGRRVKWGVLFRSDNMARLTDSGLARVKRLGIRTVCDFRTGAEAQRLPNRFPDSVAVNYLRMPIQHGEFEPTTVFERIRTGDYHWISEAFMLQGYVDNIERHAPVWARLFELLADSRNRPLLFHCTGGKDRTGVGAALILLALGVPVETVIEDYGLSDPYIAEIRSQIYSQIEAFGVDTVKVAPYFTAPPSRLRALLAYIGENYGDAVGYLKEKVGVAERVIASLKEDLLV